MDIARIRKRFDKRFPTSGQIDLPYGIALVDPVERIADGYARSHGRGPSAKDAVSAELCHHLSAAMRLLLDYLDHTIEIGDVAALERMQAEGVAMGFLVTPDGWRLGICIGEMQAAVRAMGVWTGHAENDVGKMVPQASWECFEPVLAAG